MKLRRRIAFATPFVLVIGCKKPIADPVEPDEDEPVATAPADAAVPLDAPIDAVVAAHMPVDAGVRITSRRDGQRECVSAFGIHCNPPPPPTASARVINLQVSGPNTLLTLNQGSKVGVSHDWTGCVLDNKNACAPDGDVKVLKVGEHATVVRSKLTPDQINASSKKVRLRPP